MVRQWQNAFVVTCIFPAVIIVHNVMTDICLFYCYHDAQCGGPVNAQSPAQTSLTLLAKSIILMPADCLDTPSCRNLQPEVTHLGHRLGEVQDHPVCCCCQQGGGRWVAQLGIGPQGVGGGLRPEGAQNGDSMLPYGIQSFPIRVIAQGGKCPQRVGHCLGLKPVKQRFDGVDELLKLVGVDDGRGVVGQVWWLQLGQPVEGCRHVDFIELVHRVCNDVQNLLVVHSGCQALCDGLVVAEVVCSTLAATPCWSDAA